MKTLFLQHKNLYKDIIYKQTKERIIKWVTIYCVQIKFDNYNGFSFSVSSSSIVHHRALEPHFHGHPGRRGYAPHLHHGPGKVLHERLAILAVHLHQMIQRPTAAVERLVGGEETTPRDQVLVVGVVEPHRCLLVERHRRIVTGLARPPAELREGGVHVGAALAVVSVDAVLVVEAPRCADGVRARERGHVAGVEAVLRELGDEAGDVLVRAGEVILRGISVGAARVLAAELHVPRRAAKQGDGVPGGQSEDVGTRDGGRAGVLEVGLDLVDDVEAAKRVVGLGVLLALDEGRGVIEEDRGVASLCRVIIR
jgi:hypothetical protein